MDGPAGKAGSLGGEQALTGLRRARVSAWLAEQTLLDAVAVLGRGSIAVMALKGVLLQRWIYADVSERVMCDVDVLVPPSRFHEATDRLVRAGYTHFKHSRSGVEVALRSPGGFVLDLHRHLFEPGRYRLTPESVFARAVWDTELFDSPVMRPCNEDMFCHLLGKFVTDRRALVEPRQPVLGAGAPIGNQPADYAEHSAWEDGQRLDELLRFALHVGLDAEATAAHVEACGMSRAARYVLGWVARSGHGEKLESPAREFSGALVRCLCNDPMGEVLVDRLHRTASLGNQSPASVVRAHLLNGSVAQGARSLGFTVWRRLLTTGDRELGFKRFGIAAPSPRDPESA